MMVGIERIYFSEKTMSTFTTIEHVPLEHLDAWRKATSIQEQANEEQPNEST